MATKAIKDTEKIAVGAIRTALQTWLAPQLSDISQRLTHVEGRLDGIDRRLDGVDKHLDGVNKRLDGIDKRLDGLDRRIETVEKRMEEGFRSLRSEFSAHVDAVRTDIRRLDNIADLRERMAS